MILEKIDQDLLALAKQSDNDLKDIYAQVDELCLVNSNKVLSAFIENQVSYSDFTDINGYGNYDEGRDKLERIFASILGCEDALVRPQIMSGTNALYLTLLTTKTYSPIYSVTVVLNPFLNSYKP